MNSVENTKIYLPDAKFAWVAATVTSVVDEHSVKYEVDPMYPPDTDPEAPQPGTELSVDLDSLPASITPSGTDDSSGRFLGKLPLQNTNLPGAGTPDMAALNYLNEPSILFNLRTRFFGTTPYTYTADICIAVNPYQWLNHLYSDEVRKEYYLFARKNLEPHVYGTSSAAFVNMKEDKQNQSVLVSGESGAGKTETVKILLGHLAFIAAGDDQTVIDRVLKTNPLLESFGNAKTVRNDNSSRFGKFIELQFGEPDLRLMGSFSRTYLLEKSRIVTQSPGERDYHMFYQLLAAPDDVRAAVMLPESTPLAYNFTSGGGEESLTETIEGATDGQRFAMTQEALALIHLDEATQTMIWRTVAATLLLGQVTFAPLDCGEADDEGSQIEDMASLQPVASLIGCDVDALAKACTERTMKTVGESLQIHLKVFDAEVTRDALAKELYARLFDWLVARINDSTTATPASGFGGPGQASISTVGLLDIFGFESFKVNSFEQLCINYANEKLQQKFCKDVFKTVQAEYESEHIQWQHIGFADNAHVLELLESRMGVISVLNEECVRPKGSDDAFCSKLITAHSGNAAFGKPRHSQTQFDIHHYAGSIRYTTKGFLEKNKDTLQEDMSKVMATAENTVIATTFSSLAVESGGGSAIKSTRRRRGSLMSETVATKFKNQLGSLMTAIETTQTQYVRCIKPNSVKSATKYDLRMVAEQLRCAGVLEAIRISRQAFPNRLTHREALCRFGMLSSGPDEDLRRILRIPGQAGADAVKEACGLVLDRLIKEDMKRHNRTGKQPTYQVGRTRVYFMKGLLERLEEYRQRAMQHHAVLVQRAIRRFTKRNWFVRTRNGLVAVQARCRRMILRRHFVAVRDVALRTQCLVRMVLAKKLVFRRRQDARATKIQAWVRGNRSRRGQTKYSNAAKKIQALARMHLTRRAFLVNLAEKREQDKLENQMAQLKAKLADEQARREEEALEMARRQDAAAAAAASHIAQAADAKAELQRRLDELTAEKDRLAAHAERLESTVTQLEQQSLESLTFMENLKQENNQLRKERETLREQNKTLKRENESLLKKSQTKDDVTAYMRSVAEPRRPVVQAPRSPTQPASPANKVADTPASQPSQAKSVSGSVGAVSGAVGAAATSLLFGDEPLSPTATLFPEGQPPKTPRTPVSKPLLAPPLNEFWDNVAADDFSRLTAGAEVHLKNSNFFFVVEDTYIRWREFSRSSGYQLQSAFRLELVESGPNSPSSKVRTFQETPTSGKESALDGLAAVSESAGDFVIRSAQTGRYVQTGGLFSGYCLLASATSRQDAAVFRAVSSRPSADGKPQSPAATPGSQPTPGPSEDSEFATPVNQDEFSAVTIEQKSRPSMREPTHHDFLFKLMVVGTKKWVNMRADGYVDVVSSIGDQTGRPHASSFAMEKLRQEIFYEVELHEQQLGLLVSKDLPLRVVGFTPVKPMAGRGGNQAGEAERSGRVHVNDTIAFADNADLANLSRKEIIHIIMARRPITLGFKVADHTLLNNSRVTSPKPQSPVRSRRSRSLQPGRGGMQARVGRTRGRMMSVQPTAMDDKPVDAARDRRSVGPLSLTVEEVARVEAMRDQLQESSPGSYRQLQAYNDTEHDRCLSMTHGLIRQQFPELEKLFIDKGEQLLLVLFAT